MAFADPDVEIGDSGKSSDSFPKGSDCRAGGRLRCDGNDPDHFRFWPRLEDVRTLGNPRTEQGHQFLWFEPPPVGAADYDGAVPQCRLMGIKRLRLGWSAPDQRHAARSGLGRRELVVAHTVAEPAAGDDPALHPESLEDVPGRAPAEEEGGDRHPEAEAIQPQVRKDLLVALDVLGGHHQSSYPMRA